MARFGQSLAHRGEGEPRLWTSAQIGLGCCHFPATPEAVGEAVPFVHLASGIVVTMAGRLDERMDLIAALGLDASPGIIWTDSALLAEAYLRLGSRCTAHLWGDFAFALWDPRHQQLFAARDHFGVKSFYYTADARRFAFASEPRALLDLPGVSREIDREAVVNYMAEITDNSDATSFRAVRRLREAEKLTVTARSVQIDRYYEIDPTRRLSARSDAEYEEEFRDILFRSVRRRLRSSGPVGCMLSGGLDSSAVASVAAKIHAEQPMSQVELYSLVYPEVPACDETRYIQAAVRLAGCPWHAVPVNSRRSLQNVEALVDLLQEPNVPFGTFANGTVCADAAAKGVRVVLDGHGGDETISLGYERLRELTDDGRLAVFSYEYLLLARAIPAMCGLRGLLDILTNRGLAGRVKRRLQLILSRIRSSSRGGDAPNWPYLAAGYDDRLRIKQAAIRSEQINARAQKRWHYYTISHTAQSRAFETLERLAGHTTVDLRYPMWDRELVEFCLALPSRQKLRHGYTRAITRNALREILPWVITRRRGKTNFLPQASACLLSLGKDACKKLLIHDNAPVTEFLKVEWLNLTIDRLFAGQAVASPDQQALWRGLSLAIWLQTLGSNSIQVSKGKYFYGKEVTVEQ